MSMHLIILTRLGICQIFYTTRIPKFLNFTGKTSNEKVSDVPEGRVWFASKKSDALLDALK